MSDKETSGSNQKLRFFEASKTPPQWALKPIRGGRLSGKTDISPLWRIQIMTEMFGPCGEGWGFTVDRLWTEPGEGEVCAFAQITLWWGDREQKIPGIGGSKLIMQEKNGQYTNDEAYKMAVTDALSTAMKCLGVGADIYAGFYDGSKYQPPEPQQDKTRSTPAAAAKEIATKDQVEAILAAFKKLEPEGTPAMLLSAIAKRVGRKIQRWSDLGQKEAGILVREMREAVKALEATEPEGQYNTNDTDAQQAIEATEAP